MKGKTEGKKVFWPIKRDQIDDNFLENLKIYKDALKLYYKGSWKEANTLFTKCSLPAADVFRDRTTANDCPKGWNGIWTMTTK